VSSRAYLSIGDVLTLLREEFPDVTISKIRFLESQGLVNPERSPSGYRKFFEHDVERLRWVLRQQREHFLPLKVIRDRLAAGDLTEGAATGSPASVPADVESAKAPAANGRVAQPAHAGVGARTPAGLGGPIGIAATNGASIGRQGAAAVASAGDGENGAASDDRSEEQLTKADNDAMARILADASRRAALIPEMPRPALQVVTGEVASVTAAALPGSATAKTTPGAGTAESPVAASSAARAKAAPPATARADVPAAAGSETTPAAPSALAPAPVASAGSPVPSATAGVPDPARAVEAKTSVSGRAAAAPARERSTTTSMVTGASLTAEELCSASGLSAVELASLESFGLVESTEVAGLATYDEDALTVANLAAELRVFGIEPRHLRLYKNAVDREVGLIEQVIIPLLRQRNPESRQRALDSADQLAALGQTMRATLLRSALRRHVGG
jgi:DNA-binding transcriptional MerR regulator